MTQYRYLGFVDRTNGLINISSSTWTVNKLQAGQLILELRDAIREIERCEQLKHESELKQLRERKDGQV